MQSNKNKNYLEIGEIIDFFSNSLLYGFKFFFNYVNFNSRVQEEFLKSNVFIPKYFDTFEFLVEQNLENIKMHVITTLKSAGVDISQGCLDFESFKKWANAEHNIEIYYHNKKFRISVNLMCLEDIGLCMDINPGYIF